MILTLTPKDRQICYAQAYNLALDAVGSYSNFPEAGEKDLYQSEIEYWQNYFYEKLTAQMLQRINGTVKGVDDGTKSRDVGEESVDLD